MVNVGLNANRRPLKSRSTRWAAAATRAVLATGLSANQISFLGILVAALGSWAFIEAPTRPLLFIAAAACIQLRLLANMLDGLVARVIAERRAQREILRFSRLVDIAQQSVVNFRKITLHLLVDAILRDGIVLNRRRERAGIRKRLPLQHSLRRRSGRRSGSVACRASL